MKDYISSKDLELYKRKRECFRDTVFLINGDTLICRVPYSGEDIIYYEYFDEYKKVKLDEINKNKIFKINTYYESCNYINCLELSYDYDDLMYMNMRIAKLEEETGMDSYALKGIDGYAHTTDSLFYKDIVKWQIYHNCISED